VHFLSGNVPTVRSGRAFARNRAGYDKHRNPCTVIAAAALISIHRRAVERRVTNAEPNESRSRRELAAAQPAATDLTAFALAHAAPYAVADSHP